MKFSLIRYVSMPRVIALMAALFTPVIAFAGWSLPSAPTPGVSQTIRWNGSASGPVVIAWALAPGASTWTGFGSAGVNNGQANLTATYTFSSAGSWGLKITDASSNTVDATFLYVGPPDTQPPTTPGTPSSTGVTSNSISLTWTASTDNVGVTSYEVLSNGSSVAVVSTNSATIGGLASSTTYTFQVHARDAAGNLSSDSLVSAPITTAAAPTWVYINGWTLPGNPVFGQSYPISWQGSSNGSSFVVLFCKAPGSSTWSGCGSGGASGGSVNATGGWAANIRGTWQFGVGYGGALPYSTSASITVN